MALLTNAFTTFSQKGIREDLTDAIYNISPTETPVISMIGKTKSSNTLHEWETDSLAAAAANAQLEGDTFAGVSVTATTRVQNTLQISDKRLTVTGTARAVKTAGRKDELTYQVMKKGKELRRDMEFTLMNNQAPVTGNSTTARQLRPMLSWYATNVTNQGAGGANGSITTARTDGTQGNLTEALFNANLQAVWNAGGEPSVAITGPVNRAKISAFAGPSGTQRVNQSVDRRLIASIDVYCSDFGDIRIVPDHFSRERDIHMLSPDFLALSTLRDIHVDDMAHVGDGDSAVIRAEYTLENRNEAAHGLLADLTTT